MKTVNVTVTIQLDIKGEDQLKEVQETLDLMNEIIGSSELEAQPQIFVNSVDKSDINDQEQSEE